MKIELSNWTKSDLELLQTEREKVNILDEQILELLNQRAKSSLAIGNLKKKYSKQPQIYDAKREKELLERLFSINTKKDGIILDSHIQSIWREILSSSKSLQENFKLSYLGPEGTFSYFAAKEFLGDGVSFQPCTDFLEIFDNVSEGKSSGGIIPLENSLHGTIGTCFDLFAKIPVNIEAEFYSRINLHLLSTENSLLAIKKVYSHAQPLGQASEWLRTNLPHAEQITVKSTTMAAALAQNEANSAAIGHSLLSQTLGLNLLASSIENEQKNWTRFVLITPKNKIKKSSFLENNANITYKSSIIFTLQDKVGTLAEVLTSFAKADVNLQKLESRPLPTQAWKYMFFADLNCNINDVAYEELRKKLTALSSSFTILGNYPAFMQEI